MPGLLFGAGIEYAVTPNWSVKFEYDHINYFGTNIAFADPINGNFIETEAATTNVVKVGANYRFGDVPFAPPVDRAAAGPAIFKAPVYKAPAAVANWTGCYVGVHGGGGILGDTFNPEGGSDFRPVPVSSGGFAGGQLGCDYQTGALVFGLQGEAAWSRILNRFDFSGTSETLSSDLTWIADGAVRAGIAIDRGLFYGKAGVAAGHFNYFAAESSPLTLTTVERGSTTLAGLLLGGGFEYAVAANWSVLLEIDRILFAGRLAHIDATVDVPPFDETAAATVTEVKAGINYRFGGGALPATSSRSQTLLPPPMTDWTGCYVGVHAGGGVNDDTFVPVNFGVGPKNSIGGGALGGGQAGCNYQAGMMVFGLEGQATWSNMANRFTFSQQGLVSQASERNPWSGDLAARGGIAFDRGLLYAKAGAAAGRFDFSDMDGFGNAFAGSATLMGLLLGGGVEYAFAPNWSAKLEYDHVGYLSRNVPLGPQANTSESATTNTVKAGINYKFFGPSGVVVARD